MPWFRVALGSDAPAIRQLMESVGGPWLSIDSSVSDEEFQTKLRVNLEDRRSTVVVAEDEGRLIGIAFCEGLVQDPVTVVQISVDPEHQRRGIATALLDQVISWARGNHNVRTVEARVAAPNTPARALVQRVGFVEVPREPAYKLEIGDEHVEVLLFVLEV